jgi:CheY-like chemotaxis protein
MPTILVVDDEPLIVLALEAVLEDAGYTVVTAANGRQALDRLAEGPYPDLVLLDMMMPVMNGPAVLSAMAETPTLNGMPVIILSSLPEDAIRARATGFAAILRKPYTADQVLGTIAQVLGNTGLGTSRST